MSGHIVDGQVWARHTGLPNGLRLLWWLTRCLVRILVAVARVVLWLATRLLLLALAVLTLPFSRRAAGWCFRRAFARALSGGGRMGGVRPDNGQRTTTSGGQNATTPVTLKLRPVSTQRIATARYADTPWTVKPLFGPGLLSMIVAPPGSGKTELAYGALAHAADGRPFCGWETSRPRRVLLLSEMEPQTLAPALHRWGFVTTPAGRLDALRLRYLRPRGSPGHLIDVLHASGVYAPDDDGRRPAWADVITAVLPILDRGKYDLLMVDSLARWMGNDSSNAAMLDALGALRQVTYRGIGVLAPHHCAKGAPAPYEPRGGSAILGELDLCWSLSHLPGATDRLHDPRRVLECTKSRVAELTPPPIKIERVDVDPDAPRARYGYRLLTGSTTPANVQRVAPSDLDSPAPSPTLPPQVRTVLAALTLAGAEGATVAQLAQAAGVSRQRADEAVKQLVKAGQIRAAGIVRPPNGGPSAARYVAAGIVRSESPVIVPASGDVGSVIEDYLRGAR
jgi:hypothetical protein